MPAAWRVVPLLLLAAGLSVPPAAATHGNTWANVNDGNSANADPWFWWPDVFHLGRDVPREPNTPSDYRIHVTTQRVRENASGLVAIRPDDEPCGTPPAAYAPGCVTTYSLAERLPVTPNTTVLAPILTAASGRTPAGARPAVGVAPSGLTGTPGEGDVRSGPFSVNTTCALRTLDADGNPVCFGRKDSLSTRVLSTDGNRDNITDGDERTEGLWFDARLSYGVAVAFNSVNYLLQEVPVPNYLGEFASATYLIDTKTVPHGHDDPHAALFQGNRGITVNRTDPLLGGTVHPTGSYNRDRLPPLALLANSTPVASPGVTLVPVVDLGYWRELLPTYKATPLFSGDHTRELDYVASDLTEGFFDGAGLARGDSGAFYARSVPRDAIDGSGRRILGTSPDDYLSTGFNATLDVHDEWRPLLDWGLPLPDVPGGAVPEPFVTGFDNLSGLHGFFAEYALGADLASTGDIAASLVDELGKPSGTCVDCNANWDPFTEDPALGPVASRVFRNAKDGDDGRVSLARGLDDRDLLQHPRVDPQSESAEELRLGALPNASRIDTPVTDPGRNGNGDPAHPLGLCTDPPRPDPNALMLGGGVACLPNATLSADDDADGCFDATDETGMNLDRRDSHGGATSDSIFVRRAATVTTDGDGGPTPLDRSASAQEQDFNRNTNTPDPSPVTPDGACDKDGMSIPVAVAESRRVGSVTANATYYQDNASAKAPELPRTRRDTANYFHDQTEIFFYYDRATEQYVSLFSYVFDENNEFRQVNLVVVADMRKDDLFDSYCAEEDPSGACLRVKSRVRLEHVPSTADDLVDIDTYFVVGRRVI
ncbi:MAG: hypothetical protein ACT4PT_01745 [Methanobacteriota archaeon]